MNLIIKLEYDRSQVAILAEAYRKIENNKARNYYRKTYPNWSECMKAGILQAKKYAVNRFREKMLKKGMSYTNINNSFIFVFSKKERVFELRKQMLEKLKEDAEKCKMYI